MVWISRDGPFWDDDIFRGHSGDDFFECNGDIVTDFALGEAAFRVAHRENCSTISFNPSDFQDTPLRIFWHKENSQEEIQIRNFWNLQPLEIYLDEMQPPIECWEDFHDRCQSEFPNLTFLDSFYDGVRGQPYDSVIMERALSQLHILNEFTACFDAQGNRTDRGFEIIDQYFTGEEPLFKNESETNRNKFSKELTFREPNGTEISCPYHGKISRRAFRLHFSWPVTPNDPLLVAYLGPKITKT